MHKRVHRILAVKFILPKEADRTEPALWVQRSITHRCG